MRIVSGKTEKKRPIFLLESDVFVLINEEGGRNYMFNFAFFCLVNFGRPV